MITVSKPFAVETSYDLLRIAPPEDILFFDIETTGLSAWNSGLYLIGAVTARDGSFQLYQWFSESLSDEQAVLKGFFDFASSYHTLISFNGETFDLKFLEDTAKQYGIRSPLPGMNNFDILKKLRKKRALLGLPNLKQKTVEQFLGIGRDDPYTGGELIAVYENYCRTKNRDALHFLLLHNEEDIKGMPKILPALSYIDALTAEFSVKDFGFSKDGRVFSASLCFPFSFPKPLEYCFSEEISLRFEKETVTLRALSSADELKYFYPDYRNYWYLTEEDYAIHKKLAAFVDKNCRVPATRETCYTKMRGFFLPALKNSGLPEFFREYHGEESWHLYTDKDDFVINYCKALLALI